ncbi:MAG: STAS/SEC14 domain-containing protein [Alphaproteobacteria bacterium]|nr:STAS/SEC14 domain-containing protein [Alphaproteobacteria bacterium]
MLAIIPDASNGFIEITIDGPADYNEFKTAIGAIDGLIARHGRIHVLEVIKRSKTMPWYLWLLDLGFSITHFGKFARYALVTEKGGSVGRVSKFFSDLASMEVRIFKMTEVDAARAWARGEPAPPEKHEPFVDFRPVTSNQTECVP